jgi:segregation and condensation protein A
MMADATVASETATLAPADPLWDDWDTPPRRPTIPELRLDGFDGPLDVLLDLAERQRIDLGRISIADLADQFVAAMDRLARHASLEQRADWLVLASRLVLLRTRLLFAGTPEEAAAAEQAAERELARLDALQFMRAAAAWLDARPQLRRDVFPRGRGGANPRVASYMRLMEACLTVLKRETAQAGAEQHVYRPRIPAIFRLSEALERLSTCLTELNEPAPLERFLPRVSRNAPNRALLARSALSSTFLAALELARTAQLRLAQSIAFESITVAGTGHGERPDNP